MMNQYVVKFQNDSRIADARGLRHDRWNNGQFVAVDLAQARMIAETLDGATHATATGNHGTRATVFVRVYVPGHGLLNVAADELQEAAQAFNYAAREHERQSMELTPKRAVAAE